MTPKDLKQWRIKNRYTQVELAKALDTHSITISRWENGAREIPSFLHLALGYLELKGGELSEKGKRKRKRKGGVDHG